MFAIFQEAKNCGFTAWVDEEWPQTGQNALRKLWRMYHDSSNARIAEAIGNAKLLKEVSDEKNKIQKKYDDMVHEVNKFIMDTQNEAIEKDSEHDHMKRQMAITIELLQRKIGEIELAHRSEVDVMKEKEQQWNNEKGELKEQIKKIEYQLFDVFKANIANKDKIARMKAICDE